MPLFAEAEVERSPRRGIESGNQPVGRGCVEWVV
jgi:hypothetical protein